MRPWLDGDLVPRRPGLAQLVAHGLLLQDLLGYEALSTGVWYVAIDFQLFLLAMGVIGLAAMLERRWAVPGPRVRRLGAGLVALLVVASLAVFNRHAELDSTALYFFGSYGLGMLVFCIGRASRERTWRLGVALLAALGAFMLVHRLAQPHRDRAC